MAGMHDYWGSYKVYKRPSRLGGMQYPLLSSVDAHQPKRRGIGHGSLGTSRAAQRGQGPAPVAIVSRLLRLALHAREVPSQASLGAFSGPAGLFPRFTYNQMEKMGAGAPAGGDVNRSRS